MTTGDDMLEVEMQCGCYPVGLTDIWVNLKEPGILSFTLAVFCYTCGTKAQVLMMVNKMGISCQKVTATRCCGKPCLEFSEFRARLLHNGDVVMVPLLDVTFAKECGADEWVPQSDPVSGQVCYQNATTGAMAWQPLRKALPSGGRLSVIPMQNKWVALQGAQHDYYQYAQKHFDDRTVRVNRLLGRSSNLVEVQIIDEDAESFRSLTDNYLVTKCHRCGHGIEKNEGCDTMHCKCGNDFKFFNAQF